MEIANEVIGIGVTVGLAGAGVIGTVLRWSIVRNIETLDAKMEEIKASVADLGRSLAEVRADAVTSPECLACRKECQDRLTRYQQDTVEWLRRMEDKSDKLIMMVANINNGVGGVK